MLADALQLADRAGTSGGKCNRVSFGHRAWRIIIATPYIRRAQISCRWILFASTGRSILTSAEALITEAVPGHLTMSRTRRLIDLETHGRIFNWILQVLAKHGLISGKTIGIEGKTLEANAAMRSTVRSETGESYN